MVRIHKKTTILPVAIITICVISWHAGLKKFHRNYNRKMEDDMSQTDYHTNEDDIVETQDDYETLHYADDDDSDDNLEAGMDSLVDPDEEKLVDVKIYGEEDEENEEDEEDEEDELMNEGGAEEDTEAGGLESETGLHAKSFDKTELEEAETAEEEEEVIVQVTQSPDVQIPKDVNKGKPKIIYIWNRSKWLFMSFGSTKQAFIDNGCPVHNCRLVDKKTFPIERRDEADSMLFTIRDFFEDPPERTNKKQIWLMWHYEAPLHTHPIPFTALDNLFNLTYSYMDVPETDILSPLGAIVPKPEHFKWSPPSEEEMAKKTGKVAWIVSNCNSIGQRNSYVNELSKYIKVDVYGRCGMECKKDQEHCYKKVAQDYKFYLSFESLYCKDYMTEKIWRPLSGYIVPVVLGGGDYASVLPNKSFIDVRDYPSPRHLAKHLKELDKNYQQYVEYFMWKAKLMAISRVPPGLCKLCEILHTPNYPYKSEYSFANYWDPEKYCKQDEEEKKVLHLPPLTD